MVQLFCEKRINNEIITLATLQSEDTVVHREKTGESLTVKRPLMHTRELHNGDFTAYL